MCFWRPWRWRAPSGGGSWPCSPRCFRCLADWREAYAVASGWFEQYGFWAMFLAGLTPVPFKVFTVSAGAAQMALGPFAFGCFVGRALRYFMVAGLVRLAGPAFEQHLLKYIDVMGWVVLALVAIGVIWVT